MEFETNMMYLFMNSFAETIVKYAESEDYIPEIYLAAANMIIDMRRAEVLHKFYNLVELMNIPLEEARDWVENELPFERAVYDPEWSTLGCTFLWILLTE